MYRSEKPTEGGEIFAAHRLTTRRGRAKSPASERSDADGGAGTSFAQSVGGDKARSRCFPIYEIARVPCRRYFAIDCYAFSPSS